LEAETSNSRSTKALRSSTAADGNGVRHALLSDAVDVLTLAPVVLFAEVFD
jgi:hypothetical protein